jgi:Zn-dependent protease with chaperone function
MKLRGHRRTIATLLTVLVLPTTVFAQTGTPSAPIPIGGDKEARAPIPPGVPTTRENVHLPTEGEVRLGRDSAAQVEKQFKLITSGPMYERLQRVSREIQSALERQDIEAEYRRVYKLPRANDTSKRVPFEYSFKLIDTKEVNAFSLAGGPVYVNRGLMDATTSDHELAAVLAHECAHVAFHHVEQLVRKEKSLSQKQLWGLLAAIIAGAAGGGAAVAAAGNVLLGGQLVSIATLTGYGRDLETEADRIAVMALADTTYNPVGMLTFMQKLARDDSRRGNPDYGIYQSHPYSNERVAAIKKNLTARGFRVDQGSLRQVSGSFRTEVVPMMVNGRDAAEIRLNGKLVFSVVADDADAPARERAERISARLNQMFADNLTFNDVRKDAAQSAVLLKGVPIIRVYPDDAAAAGGVEPAMDRAYREIIRALIVEQLDKPS